MPAKRSGSGGPWGEENGGEGLVFSQEALQSSLTLTLILHNFIKDKTKNRNTIIQGEVLACFFLTSTLKISALTPSSLWVRTPVPLGPITEPGA